MKRNSLFMMIVLCFAIMLVGCTTPVMEETEVELEELIMEEIVDVEQEDIIGKRIIAGTFMSAELLDLFDITPVGVITTEKTLPERYKDMQEVGAPMKPDLEIVVSLDPELYISDANLKDNINELFKEKDIETIFLSNNSYEDIFENIEYMGGYLDSKDKADDIILEMRKKEKEILNSIDNKEAPQVLILFGTPESFMIATKNSYTGSLVEKVGGVNIGDDLAGGKPMPYLPFSLETIANLNPDIILRLTHASPEISKKAFDEEFSKGFWVNLDAVKDGKVYDLDPSYFGVTANLEAINALEQITEILYK